MSLTEQPVTHTVDLKTAKDPVAGEYNDMLNDAQGLFDSRDPATRTATIKRAPIYNAATNVIEAPEMGMATLPDPRDAQPRIGHGEDQSPSFDDLDLSEPYLEPQVPAQPTVTPEQQKQVQDDAYKAFAEQFKQYMGVDLAEAQATVQELSQFRAQQQAEKQINKLAQEWGVSSEECNSRLEAVRERYSKLDQVTQDLLARDQVRAAQLIWNKLQSEQVQDQQRVPNFDRSTLGRPQQQALPKGAFYKSEIQNMSAEEYQRRQPEIMAAYASGKVFNG